MFYLSIDLETTGLDPYNCQILEMAAIAADTKNGELVSPNNSHVFQRRLWHPRIIGEPIALAMNKVILEEMPRKRPENIDQETYWVAAERLYEHFTAWTERNGWKDSNFWKAVAAGKNFASFDRPFLAATDPRFGQLFHHRSIDPGSMYIKHEDLVPPSTNDCIKRAGISVDFGRQHTAVEDARTVIKLITKGGLLAW